VFLLPRANANAWAQVHAFLPRLSAPVRGRVSVKAVEDMFEELAAAPEASPALPGHAQAMRDKYA
jgi:hypothetical protein